MKTATSTLYLYDPDFESNAKAFQAEEGGDCQIREVKDFDTLAAALNGYSGVRVLVFDTHGEPGKVALADRSSLDGFDFRFLNLLPKDLLVTNARALFLGCNIGEGKEGDTFLDDFGLAAFRGKGGIAGASTVVNVSLSLGPFASAGTWMDPTSLFSARLKVVRFDEAGIRTAAKTVDRWGDET